MLTLILYITAAVLLTLAALNVASPVSLGWAGMLCWLLAAGLLPALGWV